MTNGTPSPEAVDFERAFNQLCHLAALSRTNMIDGAVENLVLATSVVDKTGHRDAGGFAEAIHILFGARPTPSQVADALTRLIDEGQLTPDGQGYMRPTAEIERQTNERVEQARRLEEEVRDEWLSAVAASLPDPAISRQLWQALQKYLALAFRRHGAETVQLLDPTRMTGAHTGTLSSFLDRAIEETGLRSHRVIAAEAIDLFFSHSTDARTRYLAQLLDGTFTFFALTLDEATTEHLRGTLTKLSIFLDTNYIFGLLDLHQNYFVRASKELVRFVQENGLPFHLYYHEFTHQEIVRTLNAQAERLRSRRWTRALSQAAVEVDIFGGLERLYHQANAETPTDVDAFLSRFENVSLLLAPLGIDIYREGGGEPFTTMEKGLFIADYSEFLEQTAPRPRSYAAIDHDAALWLAVRRLRNPGVSVVDSGAIILTNDYRFYRFDKTLGPNVTTSRPGAVVLPAQLLQLLRPLVPATDDFDRRFVETFALPEFRTAQSGYSNTASKVMSYLATYRDVPKETAVAILRSHALAGRLRNLEEDSDAFRDAIESELVDINRGLLEEAEQLRSELADTRTAEAEAAMERLADETPANAEAVKRATRAETALTRTRWALAAVLFAFSLAAIYLGPAAIRWDGLDNHPHGTGLRLAATVVAAGLCWALAAREKGAAILGAVLGGILAITQIL